MNALAQRALFVLFGVALLVGVVLAVPEAPPCKAIVVPAGCRANSPSLPGSFASLAIALASLAGALILRKRAARPTS